MGNELATISESERAVLKVLWDRERATVRDIREHLADQGRRWAHTTINTLLSRLEQKEYVRCDRSGFAHVFSAAVTREEFMRHRLARLADDFCDGTRTPLMLALVDGQQFSDEEIEQFRALIDQLANRPKPRKRQRGKETK